MTHDELLKRQIRECQELGTRHDQEMKSLFGGAGVGQQGSGGGLAGRLRVVLVYATSSELSKAIELVRDLRPHLESAEVEVLHPQRIKLV